MHPFIKHQQLRCVFLQHKSTNSNIKPPYTIGPLPPFPPGSNPKTLIFNNSSHLETDHADKGTRLWCHRETTLDWGMQRNEKSYRRLFIIGGSSFARLIDNPFVWWCRGLASSLQEQASQSVSTAVFTEKKQQQKNKAFLRTGNQATEMTCTRAQPFRILRGWWKH